MLRVLLVAGLTLSTLATVEARGFRLPYRSLGRVHTTGTPQVSPVSVGVAAASFARLGTRFAAATPQAATKTDSGKADPVASPSQGPKAAAPGAPVEPARQAAAAGHWCDDGTLVGTGKGFCVIDRFTY